MNLPLRTLHTYVGIFIAPSVLFFALTGIVQIFSLHEARGAYRPPAFLEELSSVHKDQTVHVDEGHDHPGHDAGSPAHKAAHEHHGDGPHRSRVPTYVLKWFFVFVALGLLTTTSLGLWIGLSQPRRKRTGWSLLAAGTVIPILLAFLT